MPHKDLSVRRAYLRAYKRRFRPRWAARQANLDRAKHANERAARYGAPGIITPEEAAEVMAAGACHYCGGTQRLGIDHVIPLHTGGPNEAANLVCCCHSCNASKFRQDRPHRWSRLHDRCQDCGTTERRHRVHGLCERCYSRVASRGRRARG